MTAGSTQALTGHPVVSREEWISARTAFLDKEKEFTRRRDELARQRRELPWVKVDKQYEFDGPNGRRTLADLFEGQSQLVVYHFMYPPEWDEGCPHCSFWADSFDGIDVHLKHRDVSFVAISRAPLAQIEAFRKRMGWDFTWLSSSDSDFNYDYNVSFTPEEMETGTAFYNYRKTTPDLAEMQGTSVFFRDENGAVFHTYSCYQRGIDLMNSAYNFIDLTPRGRDEEGHDNPQYWVRHHDRYED
jgi:predicted dithiol-disulfide oxidoreductase (DUF899 family)